ncbi:MAG: MotA/TolQ/ExbB proton channel family protein [Pseudomonadota bacterium]
MLDIIFVKGGWVMYVIVSLSIYVLGIIFFKAYQFASGGVFNTQFVDRVMLHIKRGELTEASNQLAREKGPLARIMRVCVEGVMNREISMKSRESEIARVGSSELRYLESHMRGLEMASSIGPLLGLLGTVIGMVVAFAKLSESGARVDPSQLAGGIWQALITTVGGLCVAVPAMAAYYLIDSLIERIRATMRDVTIQTLALEDVFIRNEKEQEKREAIEREERVRKMVEEQNTMLNNPRGAPQSSGTLHLLNPSYTKF